MSNQYNQDVNGAIASLSRAVEGMERQCAALDVERSDLTRERKSYVVKAAERLLPAVTKQVLANLQISTPGFVSYGIEKAFRSQEKLLGLFTRSGYAQTLSLLQSQYASYLDENKHGDLKSIDAELANIAMKLERLWANHKELLELLKLMKQADAKKGNLPEALREKVVGISSVINKRKSPSVAQSRTSPQYSSTVSQQDDYSDLLIYLATDFPTSARTLLLSSIQSIPEVTETTRSNTDTFGGGGGYSNTDTIEGGGSFSNDPGISPGAVTGAVIGVGAAAVAGVAIATDDSLGRFS